MEFIKISATEYFFIIKNKNTLISVQLNFFNSLDSQLDDSFEKNFFVHNDAIQFFLSGREKQSKTRPKRFVNAGLRLFRFFWT